MGGSFKLQIFTHCSSFFRGLGKSFSLAQLVICLRGITSLEREVSKAGLRHGSPSESTTRSTKWIRKVVFISETYGLSSRNWTHLRWWDVGHRAGLDPGAGHEKRVWEHASVFVENVCLIFFSCTYLYYIYIHLYLVSHIHIHIFINPYAIPFVFYLFSHMWVCIYCARVYPGWHFASNVSL